jgi:hypothetical protein
MNQNSTPIKTLGQIIFLVILGLVLIFAITTLRGAIPRGINPTQNSTSAMTSYSTIAPDETQTVAAIITLKAIDEATFVAITRTPETPIFLPTGIYDDQRVKISASLLFIDAQNAWGGFIDGHRFTLYAGSLQSDLDQGVVGLVINLPAGKSIEQFVSPSKHGALRVISEQNSRITLIASDGTIFYFDIPTRQFVASLTEIAPSITPSPYVTSEPTGLPYPLPSESNTEVP